MEIHQLRYFCAVARTGGFTKAAQQEHLAQPSLSQQVRKLEDELGTRLFDRLGRSVRLTSFGEAFLPRAEAILRQLADAKREIEEMAGVERGQLVIGSIPTVAPYFLPDCLATFGRNFPQIRINVIEELTAELLDRVQAGTIDLAFLVLPVAGAQFLCHELLREKLFLVVPRNHRIASQSTAHLRQIEGEPFLLLKEGHCFRDNTLSACGRARVEPNVVFETGQFATILAMVAAGAGVSVVPEMAVQARKGCRFIPVNDDGSFRRVGVVQLKQHFRSRAHQVFIRHLEQHMLETRAA